MRLCIYPMIGWLEWQGGCVDDNHSLKIMIDVLGYLLCVLWFIIIFQLNSMLMTVNISLDYKLGLYPVYSGYIIWCQCFRWIYLATLFILSEHSRNGWWLFCNGLKFVFKRYFGVISDMYYILILSYMKNYYIIKIHY